MPLHTSAENSDLALNCRRTHRCRPQQQDTCEVGSRTIIVVTSIHRISYDPAKRQRTLESRGLDFEDAALVFAGCTFEVEDTRRDYGETRVICFGRLAGRLVVIGYTQRGAIRHVFSMRKANEREQANIALRLEV